MAIGSKALQNLLAKASNLRVGVIGDFCLDVYWHADMRKSELSRETPHFPLPIVQERMQPGGAGNVACNFAALRPAQVMALSILGDDWRGTALVALLAQQGISTEHMRQTRERMTNAYIKPMRHGISETVYEDPRLDFENREALASDWEEALLQMLSQAAPTLDLLYVCDQMLFGCITPRVRAQIQRWGEEGLEVWVDSRDRIDQYQHVIVKPNEVELCRAVAQPLTKDVGLLEQYAARMQAKTQRPILVTLGEKGSLALDHGKIDAVPAHPVQPPVDICGAGDSFGAAAALLHVAGATLQDAAAYAACSASLTVQKIAMTGVTTPEELFSRVEQAEEQGVF